MTTPFSTRARFAGILTAITMTAALAACSASSGESDDSAGETTDYGMAEGGGDGVAASEPEAAAEDSAQDSDGSSKSFNSSDAASTGLDRAEAPTERAVISTGTVSLRSKDVAEARRDVQRVVDAQGGEVTEENTESDEEGETSYSRLVVRVPSSKFGSAMDALEGAAEMSSSGRGGEDVTTQVIDTNVRVRAQEASLKRVELLLSRAQSLKDIIWIESQLTNRQAELDSLKSQQAWLRDQTSLSTITVDITKLTKKEAKKKDQDEAGFLVGLKGGMKALVASSAAILTIVGALLPFAVILLLVGFPVWLLVRRRKSAEPTAPQPQA